MTPTKPDCTRRSKLMRVGLPIVLLLVSHLFVSAQAPAGYAYGKMITINASQVSGTQTNFPVLINLTDPDLRTNANGGHMRSASANDVLFALPDGTNLPYQIEKYTSSATTAQYVAWVKVPSISSGSSTIIGIYYGKAGVATNPSTTAIWDANYLGVWHFNNSINDGSPNAKNLTQPASTTANFTGSKIGDGRQLNNSPFVPSNSGSCRYLQLPSGILGGVSNFTFEGWVLVDDNTTSWERVFDFGKSTTVNMFLTPSMATNGIKRFAITTGGNAGEQQVSSGTTTASGAWHHFAVTIDNSTNTSTLYFDGVADATNTGVTLRPSDMATDNADYFGRSQYTGDEGFYGKFDEFRLSKSVRSSSWIQTSYNNQNSPSTFYSISAEMTAAATFVALPVGLRSFQGMAAPDGSVQLVWQTASEINNKQFVIERSAGNDQWASFKTVPAAIDGQNGHLYTEYDKNPFYPVSAYRLKQVDIDGKETSLSTVAVRLSSAAPGNMVLYPNPAGNQVVATLKTGFLPATVKVQLTDWLGRAYAVPFSVAGNTITVHTAGLPNGNYALSVGANGVQYAEKLLIAK